MRVVFMTWYYSDLSSIIKAQYDIVSINCFKYYLIMRISLLLWRGWLHFAVAATGDRSHGAHFRVCKAAPAALKDRGRLKRCPEGGSYRGAIRQPRRCVFCIFIT